MRGCGVGNTFQWVKFIDISFFFSLYPPVKLKSNGPLKNNTHPSKGKKIVFFLFQINRKMDDKVSVALTIYGGPVQQHNFKVYLVKISYKN